MGCAGTSQAVVLVSKALRASTAPVRTRIKKRGWAGQGLPPASSRQRREASSASRRRKGGDEKKMSFLWQCNKRSLFFFFPPSFPGKGVSGLNNESCQDCSCAYLDLFIYLFRRLLLCQPIHHANPICGIRVLPETPQLRGRARSQSKHLQRLRTERYFNNLKLYGSFWLRGKLFTNSATPTTLPPPTGAHAEQVHLHKERRSLQLLRC